MKYTNVKVPATTAWLDTDQDIFDMLDAIVGKGCTPCGEPLNYDAFIGYSGVGPWVEGDIIYMRDGLCYTLAYDFMVFDDTARVFRVGIDRLHDFDERNEIIPSSVRDVLERHDLAVSGWEKSLGRYTFELNGHTDAGGDMTHSLYVDERDISSAKAWYKALHDVWNAFSPWEEAHKWCDVNGVPNGTPFDDGDMLYEDLRSYMEDTLGEALDDLHALAFGTRKF